MRLAVIDCGTNTFNLIVVDLAGSGFRSKVFNTRVSVKLGQGSIHKGFIGEEAFARAVKAVRMFHEHIVALKVDKTLAFATSAIRDASNGLQFVKEIKSLFGMVLHVIDGEREAELIYMGVKTALSLKSRPSLIMDIGGGSTEFILANESGILWKHSFNIGAARLLEKFAPSDPIKEAEKKHIRDFLHESTVLLFDALKKWSPHELIGSSGAFDSLIEMIHGEMGGEALTQEKTEYKIYMDNYIGISKKVISSTLEERKKIKGLLPMRIDMIVISCLMINYIMEECGLSNMRVSVYSLKEGALAEYIQNLNTTN